ncbi:Opi1-domain-containing protein [Agrocybe pediades]|nr:Opi1-domain-containing protein [Agrocybe pediades]
MVQTSSTTPYTSPRAGPSSPALPPPSSSSSSSSTSPPRNAKNSREEEEITADNLEDQDESVRIAVRALGDMRSGGSGAGTSKAKYEYAPSSASGARSPPPAYDTRTTSNASSNSNSYGTAPTHAMSSRTVSVSSSSAGTPPGQGAASPAAVAAAIVSTGGGGLVSRMSHLPLVGSALRVYEQGKASSRVVKYGAEMVESSVKSISRPVIDRLPVNVDRLDEFACRQLDRLDRYRRPSASTMESPVTAVASPSSSATPAGNSNATTRTYIKQEEEEGSDHEMAVDDRSSSSYAHSRSRYRTANEDDGDDDYNYNRTARRQREEKKISRAAAEEEEEEGEDIDMDMDAEIEGRPVITRREWVVKDEVVLSRGGGRGRGGRVPSWLEATSPFVMPPPPPPEDASPRSRSDVRGNKGSRSSTPTQANTSSTPNEGQVAQRSRWQAVLLEAGGLSAALSEESMKRLKYCLQWLQYATAHIDAQILILRDFTASLQPLPSTSSHPQPRPAISPEQLRRLTAVRKDLVQTVRQVVDVVSKYAGASLPEPAKKRVRGFILKLPQRWASVAKQQAGGVGVGPGGDAMGMSMGLGDMERQDRPEASSSTVAAAAGTGTGVVRRAGGHRRAAHRERGVDGGSGYRSGPSSRATSPVRGAGSGSGSGSTVSSPRVARAALESHREDAVVASPANVSASTAMVAAQRILALATESLDMMRGVTGVVKDSLDRAETWVGRLRTVGIQRGATDDGAEDAMPAGFEGFPGDDAREAEHREAESRREKPSQSRYDFQFSDKTQYRHTRNISDNSNYDPSEIDMEYSRERGRDRDRGSTTPPPPFFSAATASTSSGSTWGSSVPGTPGSVAAAPLSAGAAGYTSFGYANSSAADGAGGVSASSGSGYGQFQPQSQPQGYGNSYGSPRLPQSPLTIPLSAMTLESAANSRYGSRNGSLNGTPRSVVIGLPKEDDDEEDRRQGVRVMGDDSVMPTMARKDVDIGGPVKVVQADELVDGAKETMDIDSAGDGVLVGVRI